MRLEYVDDRPVKTRLGQDMVCMSVVIRGGKERTDDWDIEGDMSGLTENEKALTESGASKDVIKLVLDELPELRTTYVKFMEDRYDIEHRIDNFYQQDYSTGCTKQNKDHAEALRGIMTAIDAALQKNAIAKQDLNKSLASRR